jgi:hypothetical protein
MIKSKWLGIPVLLATGFVAVWTTNTPAQEPAVAMICRGELRTFRTDAGKTITTPFKWAKEVAGKENPGAGECAWFDRAPLPTEQKTGRDNALHGNPGPFSDLPVGTFAKLCVDRSTMTIRSVVRSTGHQTAPFQLPPFNTEGCPT